jgi:23S rRNA pseudouridine1911/1915/1917 synthase
MNRILSYTVPPEEDGCKAEVFLRRRGFSHHLLSILRRTELGLTRNGVLLFTTARLQAGDALRVLVADTEASPNIVPRPLPFPIVYEDEDILVVDKPANMPIHPSQGNYENTLGNAAAYYFAQKGQPFVYRVINRLDRDTTGLLILAKNPLSSCILSAAAKERRIHREYFAIAEGVLPKAGVIDAPIGHAPHSTVLHQVDFQHGKPAVTHFKRLKVVNGQSLAAVTLETGRTHQIRVHFRYLGHPLPGDFLYNPHYEKIGRQALHSHKLAFIHPITGEPLEFTSPLPADMQQCLEK